MTGIITGIGWRMVGAASAASYLCAHQQGEAVDLGIDLGSGRHFLLGLTAYLCQRHPASRYVGLLRIARWIRRPQDFLFGCMWGVGNVSYGLTMRYLGMSLGIGVAIGVTLVVGTLIPPLIHGQGGELVSTRGGLLHAVGGRQSDTLRALLLCP